MVFVKDHEDQKFHMVPALRGLKCDIIKARPMPVLAPPGGVENKQTGPQRRSSFPGEARRLLEAAASHREGHLMAGAEEDGDAGALPGESDVDGHRGGCTGRLPIIGKSKHRRQNQESEDKNNQKSNHEE